MLATARTMHTEESAEVEVLLANMEKLKALTRKISTSLSTLDEGGHGLQSSIRPMYGNTGRLQTANQNIEVVKQSLARLREDREKQRREGGTIKSGIRNVPLVEYTAAMDRMNVNVRHLQSNPVANQPAITEMNGYLKQGAREMEGLFEETLRQDSAPLEPLSYLLKGHPFPRIPNEHVQTLAGINHYMTTSGLSNFRTTNGEPRSFQFYFDTRSVYIAQALHNLASASVSTARKTDPAALYTPNKCSIGQYCKAIEDLFGAEAENISAIFTREQQTLLHTRTVNPALEEFAATLRDLNEHIKRHLITDCTLSYEIIDYVSRLSVRLDAKNPDLKPVVQEALRPIRSTAQRSLPQLISDVTTRCQTLAALPADASVTPITHATMERLQGMTNYVTQLGSLLAAENRTLDVGTSNESRFASYIASMLDALLNALDTKSRMLHKSKGVQAMFMANTLCVIGRGLTSPMFSLIPQDEVKAKLAPWRKKGAASYVDTWIDVGRYLQEVQVTSSKRPQSGAASGGDSAAIVKALSRNEKDGIKKRFGDFNAGLEELVVKHKSLKIENEIRGDVSRDIARFLEPLYNRFWDRYHEIDKGKGKVSRYTKEGLSGLLAGL